MDAEDVMDNEMEDEVDDGARPESKDHPHEGSASRRAVSPIGAWPRALRFGRVPTPALYPMLTASCLSATPAGHERSVASRTASRRAVKPDPRALAGRM